MVPMPLGFVLELEMRLFENGLPSLHHLASLCKNTGDTQHRLWPWYVPDHVACVQFNVWRVDSFDDLT